MSTRILLAVAAFLMTWTEYVQADVVYLKDGSHLEGVILEETDSYVVIEFRVASIVGQKRIERADIVSIARDTEERNKETSQPTETTDTQTVDQGAKGGDAEAAWSGVTAVAFRIDGVVGRDVKPYEIALYTRLIRNHGISDVIIEIDSPGRKSALRCRLPKPLQIWLRMGVLLRTVTMPSVLHRFLRCAATSDMCLAPDASAALRS